MAFSDRLAAARHLGDPAADAAVAAFAALPGRTGWRALDIGLARGGRLAPGDPPELAALLAPLLEPPPWADLALADAGAVAFWRVGAPTLFVTMTYGSLAFGYQSAELVRPLAATGRLERMARRRLGETIRWAMAATAPGGARPGAAGWAATVRVRLVHALVRRHLSAAPWWDHDAWGVPISAAGGFLTAIGGFLVVPMRAMRDLGVRFSPAEQEAMTHLWRWIGFCMGVPEDLLPASMAEASERMDAAIAADEGPSPDSARLMRALLHHGLPVERVLPGPAAAPARLVAAHLAGGLTRRWMGTEMADRLEVPGAAVARLVPLLRPLTVARHVALAGGVLGSDERVTRLERALVRRALAAAGAPRAPLGPAQAGEAPVLEAA